MFDSHCHLTDRQFAADRDDVLARAWAAGLEGLVTIASNAPDADAACALALTDPRIGATVGIHPHEAAAAGPDQLRRIRELVDRPRVVAIGETGLDFHYDNSPRDVQRRLFDWHLRLAADSGLPVVVHSRSADEDMTAAVRAAGQVRGVLHCFTGGRTLLEAAADAGWFIAYGGIATFARFDGADLLRDVPTDRLLLETDSPYLAPVPHRGRRNEPSYIVETCRAVARLTASSPEDVARRTTANARTFFGLPAGPPGP
ncbi:MAG TPA: TatD family hydrolase [Longimicrobiales bacterium]|nr:TatD family hydrolase [Longimicrobiales bacterium]